METSDSSDDSSCSTSTTSTRSVANPTATSFLVPPSRRKKRRKGESIVDAENAFWVVTNDFNLSKSAAALGVDERELRKELVLNVKAGWVFNFSTIPETTLATLELREGILKVRPELKERMRAEGDALLKDFQGFRNLMKEYSYVRNEAGSRALLDTLLFAAIHGAQNEIKKHRESQGAVLSVIELDKERTLRRTLDSNLLLAMQYSVDAVEMGTEINGHPMTLHGRCDYAILAVDDDAKDAMKIGVKINVPSYSHLISVVEAKHPDTLDDGMSQIKAQILALRRLTRRSYFAGAISDGHAWRFFAAFGDGAEVDFYKSTYMTVGKGAGEENKEGLIVAILKALIMSPGGFPSSFDAYLKPSPFEVVGTVSN